MGAFGAAAWAASMASMAAASGALAAAGALRFRSIRLAAFSMMLTVYSLIS